MSAGRKLVTIFGATGAQGGSVLKAMLNNPSFKLRAVTRNAQSDKAKALASQGVEVVTGDVDDASSVEKAVQGSYGVFLVTNYWAHLDEEKEVKQGKDTIDACRKAGVQHFVYSGEPNVKRLTGISCPHYDSKGRVVDYLQTLSDLPFTTVQLAAYMENFTTIMKPRKMETGDYVFDAPMKGIPTFLISVTDMGEVVHKVFQDFDRFKNKVIGIGGDYKTIEEYAATLNKYFPDRKYVACEYDTDVYAKLGFQYNTDVYAQLGFPGAEDLAGMFKFKQVMKEDIDLDLTKELNPQVMSFEDFVKKNLDAFK